LGYCKPSKATEPPLAKTLKFVNDRLKGHPELTVRSQDGGIRISVEGTAIPDDKEWFAGVLEALTDKQLMDIAARGCLSALWPQV
jgi:hypothetical protein